MGCSRQGEKHKDQGGETEGSTFQKQKLGLIGAQCVHIFACMYVQVCGRCACRCAASDEKWGWNLKSLECRAKELCSSYWKQWWQGIRESCKQGRA